MGILALLLCCRKSDKKLAPIINKRLETGRVQNTKISLMVTASIAFLMFQAGAQTTSMYYFEGVMYWLLASDILVSCSMLGSTKYLNEIPISKELDYFMSE